MERPTILLAIGGEPDAHVDALQKSFAGVRVDYSLLDTSKPLDHALYRYLGSRQKLMKAR